MRLISPRSTALYQTLEKSPRVTSPNTTAPFAMYTPWPRRGFLRRKVSNCWFNFSMISLWVLRKSVDSSAHKFGDIFTQQIHLQVHSVTLFSLAQGCHFPRMRDNPDAKSILLHFGHC